MKWADPDPMVKCVGCGLRFRPTGPGIDMCEHCARFAAKLRREDRDREALAKAVAEVTAREVESTHKCSTHPLAECPGYMAQERRRYAALIRSLSPSELLKRAEAVVKEGK